MRCCDCRYYEPRLLACKNVASVRYSGMKPYLGAPDVYPFLSSCEVFAARQAETTLADAKEL